MSRYLSILLVVLTASISFADFNGHWRGAGGITVIEKNRRGKIVSDLDGKYNSAPTFQCRPIEFKFQQIDGTLRLLVGKLSCQLPVKYENKLGFFVSRENSNREFVIESEIVLQQNITRDEAGNILKIETVPVGVLDETGNILTNVVVLPNKRGKREVKFIREGVNLRYYERYARKRIEYNINAVLSPVVTEFLPEMTTETAEIVQTQN